MTKYNYREAVCNDIRDYIEEHYGNNWMKEYSSDEFAEMLNDELWIADSVTGNASGSYTFSAWEAEENISHNLDLLKEAADEFCCDYSKLLGSAEACDVTIRCYLLGECIGMVLDEIN